MKNENLKNLIPQQETGKAIDAKGSTYLNNENEAKAFFEVVKQRLHDVNQWSKFAGNLSANFQLVNSDGIEVHRSPQKGDYFKIDIPGPGSKTGNGYDWVQIEDIESTSSADFESYGFRVRPAENPQRESEDIAHFYSPESTSTFAVARNGNKVTAEIYDRNTKPNKEAEAAIDKIRDAVVGTFGVISFSKIQWQKLVDGLLSK